MQIEDWIQTKKKKRTETHYEEKIQKASKSEGVKGRKKERANHFGFASSEIWGELSFGYGSNAPLTANSKMEKGGAAL